MAIVAVSISPLGEGPSVSRYVVAAERALSGYPNIKRQIGPMFTTLEGDLDEIWQAVRAMQEAVFELGAGRVVSSIKIDDRRDKAITMEGKVKAVEEKLQD